MFDRVYRLHWLIRFQGLKVYTKEPFFPIWNIYYNIVICPVYSSIMMEVCFLFKLYKEIINAFLNIQMRLSLNVHLALHLTNDALIMLCY